jgi:hypothetical protein
MKEISINKSLIDSIESISDIQLRAKIYTCVFEYCFNKVIPELHGIDLMTWNLLQPHMPKNDKLQSPKKGKHLFKNSPYFDLATFTEAFKTTTCYARHPNLDIELIHDMMVNSEAKGYMYLNWIQAAANWVSREPHKYTKSIKSAIQKDPAFALMTKGDIARAEHDAKMALQRKLINNGNDPYTY